MTDANCRIPPLLDARVLQMEPLTQWWHHEDVVCVALRCVSRMPVITVAGAFDRRAWPVCRRALEAALRHRPRCVLVDLAAVTSVDDHAANLLEAMRRASGWHGSQFWLAAVPDPLRAQLELAGLLAEFPISRNAARAVEEIRRSLDTSSRRHPPPTSRTA
ncbi:MAG: STAS domain-containing protein [Kineosporiaceae bacterium]|nr:STAS domain-containing protein [Kineosporiaceae bacterium]